MSNPMDGILDEIVEKGQVFAKKKVDRQINMTPEEKLEDDERAKKPTYVDPQEVKNRLKALEIMGRNRQERRRLSKLNNGMKIPGLTKPYRRLEQ